MTAKSATERMAALRERAAALGLKRLEIYSYPEDWVAIKALDAGILSVPVEAQGERNV